MRTYSLLYIQLNPFSMNRLAILVVCLGVIASASLYEDLNAIESSEFGRTLLDTLQMHMESGDPVARFQEIISQIESLFEADQKDADAKNRATQDLCDRDIADFNTDNNALLRRLSEIQAVLDRLNPLLQRTTEIFNQKTTFRNNLQSELDELTKQRNQEAAEYQQRIEHSENNYLQYVIETVRRMFTEGKFGSFLQTGDTNEGMMKQVQELLQQATSDADKFVFRRSYKQMFMMFAQITSKVSSPGLVQRIIDLCDVGLKFVEENVAMENRTEQGRIENFNIERSRLEKDINNLNIQINQLQASILQTTDKITVTKRDQTDTRERQGQKAQQIEDRDTECTEAAYNYQQARNRREENRLVVSQIIGIFAANQRQFKEYVGARTAAGDFQGQDFKVLTPA